MRRLSSFWRWIIITRAPPSRAFFFSSVLRIFLLFTAVQLKRLMDILCGGIRARYNSMMYFTSWGCPVQDIETSPRQPKDIRCLRILLSYPQPYLHVVSATSTIDALDIDATSPFSISPYPEVSPDLLSKTPLPHPCIHPTMSK